MVKFPLLIAFVLVLSFERNHGEKNKSFMPKLMVNFIKNKAEHILKVVGGNTQCAKDLKAVINDAVLKKKWALQMIDATGKFPSGILFGNIYMNGHFDQCLNIKETKTNSTIHGQYCTVSVTPTKNYDSPFDLSSAAELKDVIGIKTNFQTNEMLKLFKLTYGLCIPHSCTISNLQKLSDHIEGSFRLPFHLNFVNLMCSTKLKSIEPYDMDKFVYALFGVHFLIILLSTGYDVIVYQRSEGEKDNIWISFSVYTNAKKIFKMSNIKKEDSYLDAVTGLKVVSMLWVIYGHRVLLNMFSGINNLVYLAEWKSQLHTVFVLSTSFSVDTFLTLSGLLLSYGVLNYMQSRGKDKTIPVVPLYIYRILRLNPGLLAMILFNISIMKNLADGPIWPLVATKSAFACLKTGIATFFFVNNYMNVNYQCVEPAWSLAVDTQLFLISPIILAGLARRPLATCLSCISACILSGLYTFYITVKYQYGAIYFEGQKDYHQNIYQPTLVRMPSWIIGVMIGYLIVKYRNEKFSKNTIRFGWCLASATMTGLILVHLVFTKNNEYNALNAALFNSSARQLWSLAIGLVVFLCSVNRNGTINKFLTLPIFQILVRISYSVYLTHFSVILYFTGSKKESVSFSNLSNIHDFLGDLVFVFIIATLFCLAFESPFIAVAKYIFKREKESEQSVSSAPVRRRKKKNKVNLVCVYQYEQVEDVSNKKEL